MKKTIKNLFNILLWTILLILFVIGIYIFNAYVINKDVGGLNNPVTKDANGPKSGLGSNSKSKYNTGANSGSGSSSQGSGITGEDIKDGVKDGAGKVVDGSKKAIKYITTNRLDENTDYNTFYFDDSLLMFEGEDKNGYDAQAVLNRMLSTAEGQMFSRPDMDFETSDTIYKIQYVTLDEYVEALKTVRDMINLNGNYSISFNYGKLHAIAREVVIVEK